MAKPEWGTKRICQSCGAPFYDLKRDPIVCPKCSAVFDPEAVLKSRRTRGPEEEAPAKPKPQKAVVEEVEVDVDDEEDILDGDDDDDDVLEDASDLGDDDDVAGVIEAGDDDDT